MRGPTVTPADFRGAVLSDYPWVVRVALALHDYGRPLPFHLALCVQMVRKES